MTTPSPKRVLFVDDEPSVLLSLDRVLKDMRPEWEIGFAHSGPVAIEMMRQNPFDVVVTDTLSPGFDGSELLNQVARSHPKTVRIVLSGHLAKEKAINLLGTAHQYLSKPCRPEILKETLGRAFSLRDMLTNEQLQSVVAKVQSLPTLPAHYLEMLDELRAEDPSIDRLGSLITQDPGMCTKLLRLVNSPFFGLPQVVTEPVDAIIYMGLQQIRNIIISLQLFSVFDTVKIKKLSFEQLWQHSWRVGTLMRGITEELDIPGQEHALVCGLVHDVGKLVLGTGLFVQYQAMTTYAAQHKMPIRVAEQELLGTTHAEIGAYLLGLWGFSVPVIQAIALHHQPESSPDNSFNLATALHIANALEHHTPDGSGSLPPDLNQDYLEALGVADRLPHWMELAEESRTLALQQAA